MLWFLKYFAHHVSYDEVVPIRWWLSCCYFDYKIFTASAISRNLELANSPLLSVKNFSSAPYICIHDLKIALSMTSGSFDLTKFDTDNPVAWLIEYSKVLPLKFWIHCNIFLKWRCHRVDLQLVFLVFFKNFTDCAFITDFPN